MTIAAFFAYSVIIFWLGIKHERATVAHQAHLDRLLSPFVPHRPRLLVSPHWPAVQAINHTEAGAGLSRGNDEPLKDVGAAGFVPGWSAACPNLSDVSRD